MLTFYDPITDSELDVSNATIFYLVRIYEDPKEPANNTFRIQGLSASIERLASDPITQETMYWPIPVEKLLANLQHENIKSLLSFEGQLIKRPLSLQDVRTCFQFNPNGTSPQRFNEEVRRELNNFWAENLPQAREEGQSNVCYATDAQISELVALSQGFFAADDLLGYLEYVIQRVATFCKQPLAQDLLANGYFTQDNLLTLAFEHDDISELLTDDCVRSLREQTITGDDIQRMRPRDKRLLLIHPCCLMALREQHTSIDELRKLTLSALSEAIAHNAFPSPNQWAPSI